MVLAVAGESYGLQRTRVTLLKMCVCLFPARAGLDHNNDNRVSLSMPRAADSENIPPFVPTRGVKTRLLSHYPRVSGLVRQRRRHAARSANASALNLSTNTYASEDIPLAFSGSLIVESMSPKSSTATTTGLATPPASQITVPTHLSISPPLEGEIRKYRVSVGTSYFP